MVDLAAVLAACGEAIADIDKLRHVVGSGCVAGRGVTELGGDHPSRAGPDRPSPDKVRRLLWSQLPDGLPASPVAGTESSPDSRDKAVHAALVTCGEPEPHVPRKEALISGRG